MFGASELHKTPNTLFLMTGDGGKWGLRGIPALFTTFGPMPLDQPLFAVQV